MNRTFIGLALAISTLMSGKAACSGYATSDFQSPSQAEIQSQPVVGASSASSSTAGLTPLKASDFITVFSDTIVEGGDSWEVNGVDCEIDAKFMKKMGFVVGKNRRYIRKDVIVWKKLEKEGNDVIGGSIYLRFTTEEAAKAFMKTCDEFGWSNDDPDQRGNFSASSSVMVSREGRTVRIGYDLT